jgi:hypothetical protein
VERLCTCHAENIRTRRRVEDDAAHAIASEVPMLKNRPACKPCGPGALTSPP